MRSRMFTAPSALPDDPATLQLILRAALTEIERLQLLIHGLQRNRFGRRSEKLDDEQLQRGLEDLEQSVAEQEAGLDAATTSAEPSAPEPKTSPASPRAQPAKRNRGTLPAHLPRIEVIVDVEDKACPCCGGTTHVIGDDVAEMLDYAPAQFRVKVIRRPRRGCRACEGAVIQAPAPDRPIDGGMATEALLAHILISKYGDSLPLYRQAQIFARHGVTLDRSTLCDWVGRACWWLAPFHELMLTTVLASPKIFADDTTLPVLDPGRGKTKTGRLWCYAVDNRPWCGPGHPAAVYIYSDDRKGVHPAEHLKGYSGLLQVDGYAGFARLVTAPAGDAPQLAFCWAHNLESVFMWGSRAEDAAWPTISPRRTPDKFASLASLAVCGRTSLQIPLRTASTADAYVRNHEWRDARLPGCPLHQMGGCSFARHGSYPRATPRGCRIAPASGRLKIFAGGCVDNVGRRVDARAYG